MSYFGGLGAGKGWNTFNFVLTPIEFESIFSDLKFYFVITDTRVATDYKKTDPQFIFNGYKYFFNEIVIGEKEYTRNEHFNYENKIRISITDDINKINFEDIIDERRVVSNEFKLTNVTEPIIDIKPLYLSFFKEKESMSIAYMNINGTIGLQLNYPKFISNLNGNNSIIDAHTFSTYNLYTDLVKNIKAISNKAKVQSNTKLYHPNFWISQEAKKIINENRYLKSNELILF